MVRYLVRAGDRTNAYFDSLKKARAYAYGHTRSDARSYIYTGPDPDDRVVGMVYKYDLLYWNGKGGSYFLYPDGSVRPLEPPKKSKARTNGFGLNWNLK